MTTARAMAIAALVVSAACSRESSPAKQQASTSGSESAHAAGAAAAGANPTSPIPSGTRTLLTGWSSGWDDMLVNLQLWHRDGDGWKPDGELFGGVLGIKGSAWGRGLHGDGQPPRQNGPVKEEGDGRTPAGVFALSATYGYAGSSLGKMPYTPVTDTWRCIDDPASLSYNKIVDENKVSKDWSSAEDMRRHDELYEWVITVDHNKARVKKGGSCVFLHIWRNGRRGTAGCTAMPRASIERLLGKLDSADQPVYVLLPKDEYDALAPTWGLPPRMAPQ